MAEQLFQVTNTVALLAWLPLLALPGNRFVTDALCRRLVPAGLAICYVAVIGWQFAAGGPPPGNVMTIAGLREAFANDFVFAAAWTHYLVFDMVVGTVIAREAVAAGIPWPLRSLSLLLTFLSGPVGYLLHLGFRLRWQATPSAAPLADVPA